MHEEVGIFFDRDGTINVELDYISDPDKLELVPGAAKAIREANEFGVKVFVITNQSGVARGLYTEHDVEAVHTRLRKTLADHGAHLDAIYYCPHHPEYGTPAYRKVCTCRKPKTGMLQEARKSFRIDLSKSYVVGDKCTDIEAGRTAHCGTVLVLTGYGAAEAEDCGKAGGADHVAKDIYAAWHYIRKNIDRTQQR
ncbi:MAG: D-glycero-beta-D-manno-heptose 1,7-bisphosphate 7-phosphatase [Ignavibacteriales bacterium]|nr:D-glycero-beta-D-manno-heptose 1,7-bisphosphate 7-phosphatase [Ignavibacteriales bacterium]